MQSSNPVLTRLGESARQGFGQGYQPGYGGAVTEARPDRMTLDDVVVRTVGLLALTGVVGAASWLLLPNGPTMMLAMIGSGIAALVLGLAISFMQITNPFVISAYAVLQGVLLGVVSRWFESLYEGIVLQAVAATFGIFFVMAALYKFRILRATKRFTKIVMGALIGIVALMLLNFVLYMFDIDMGIRSYDTSKPAGLLAIGFSIVVIIVGALTFILDFDMIEKGAQAGMPQKFAWYCAFGLLVGLIFLYWEILRLLSYLRR